MALALEEHRRSGRPVLDLTFTNPTHAGIDYPAREIAEALALGNAHLYEPDPRGTPSARRAISDWYDRRGFHVDPDRVVLTPGTSESYSWLFKLLCDPGDSVLVPRPSYPLFEFLATLESAQVRTYPLRKEVRWEIDRDALRLAWSGTSDAHSQGDANPVDPVANRLEPIPEGHRPAGAAPSGSRRSRAIVVVNPNNPTGSYLSGSDAGLLREAASEGGLALISDEVFFSYPLEGALGEAGPSRPRGPSPATPGRSAGAGSRGRERSGVDRAARDRPVSLLGCDETPAFVLDGLSKSAGLPGMKVGWIVVLGPPRFREDALARLEMIADTYLSVGSVVQRALPRLIELGEGVAAGIRERTRSNLDHLRGAVPDSSACAALPIEGGWAAVLRVPCNATDEDLCLELLDKDDVLLQPGWFFDFESEGYLVASLLCPEDVFREGLRRLLGRVL